jgi:hypothetical protein
VRHYFTQSCFILLALITSNISAGIIYASKWKYGDQTVCLYGDNHGTHNTFEIDEKKMSNAFYENLFTSKDRWLVLREDVIGESISKELQWLVTLWFYNKNLGFLTTINTWLAHDPETKIPHIDTINIDLRANFNNVSTLIRAYKFTSEGLLTKENHKRFNAFYGDFYNALKDIPLKTLFDEPITKLIEYINNTSNNKLKAILKRVLETISARQIVLYNNGFMSLIEPCLINEKSFDAHEKIFDFVTNNNSFINHLLEIVESTALWHIVEGQKTHKKIAVIAGNSHILNLEKYLLEMGYSEINSYGSEYKKNSLEKIKLVLQIAAKKEELFNDQPHKNITDINFYWNLSRFLSEYGIEEKIDELEGKLTLISHDAFAWLSEEKPAQLHPTPVKPAPSTLNKVTTLIKKLLWKY